MHKLNFFQGSVIHKFIMKTNYILLTLADTSLSKNQYSPYLHSKEIKGRKLSEIRK